MVNGSPTPLAASDPVRWQMTRDDVPGQGVPHVACVPFRGAVSCACGGRWRYVITGSATDPVWRCLHCGILSTMRRYLRLAPSDEVP